MAYLRAGLVLVTLGWGGYVLAIWTGHAPISDPWLALGVTVLFEMWVMAAGAFCAVCAAVSFLRRRRAGA